ncbi:C40 family peptidase [Flavobacterium sp. HNIBRBA15423]|uniref:C40 family peptidase n=1 Tax=Flavobacterium sp. HNIBRBA15423 TaxID=3458683 RepID=UPI004044327F
MKVNFFIVITTMLISFQCYNAPKTEASKLKSTKLELIETEILKEKILKSEISELEIDRQEIVAFAKNFIDVPYVYSSQDPEKGFDCSGFVNYVFKNFNITVPRSSSGFKNFGKKINVEDVAIGDVLVFNGYQDSTSIGHLGIVCEANGFNSKFIHASSGKAMKVTISDLNSSHYSKRFYQAVDVINQ